MADWRTMLTGQVNARAQEVAERAATSLLNGLRVVFTAEAFSYVRQAAERRGISVVGYVRRATLSHVGRDLGIPVRDLISIDRPSAGYGQRGQHSSHMDLDGELYGSWEI